jgi:hypothetical protein
MLSRILRPAPLPTIHRAPAARRSAHAAAAAAAAAAAHHTHGDAMVSVRKQKTTTRFTKKQY